MKKERILIILIILIVAAAIFLIWWSPAIRDQTCKLQGNQAVAIYSQPATSGPVVGFLQPGDAARQLAQRGQWRLILTNEDLAGWIEAEKWCR